MNDDNDDANHRPIAPGSIGDFQNVARLTQLTLPVPGFISQFASAAI